MNAEEAALRFPDWGQLCKWLTGASYWHSWQDTRKKIDLDNMRSHHVGYYARIREPLNLDFSELRALKD
jgi:hypothetical protein